MKLDYFDHNTDNETSEYKNVSTSTEEIISDNPKDSFWVLAERSDTLQNFFLSETSDIKTEIKNNCNQKIWKDMSAGNDEKMELLQNQIIYWREECNPKFS